MCGIAGLWRAPSEASPPEEETQARQIAEQMANTILHRGPDAGAVWAEGPVGLSHRRLSIIDVSQAGAQPMHCALGRYVLSYNGEIYNHLALRAALMECGGAGPKWRGTSDTETLLAGISHWGLKETLERAFGMFALCLWDRKTQQMSLARDRMGEKPLYWRQGQTGVQFGSEPVVFGPLGAPDPAQLADFLRRGYVPDQHGITVDLHKVQPGQILTFYGATQPPAAQLYWRLPATQPRDNSDGATALSQLHHRLRSVVAEQMLSDVPLGSFLSGGVDSSLVTALMRADGPVRSFSIGFDDATYNEAPQAAAVAAHLKTDHTEFIVSEDDALEAVQDLARVYAEPFADSSQLPTLLLARLAKRDVTVALTGDGGDEVFGGYNRYLFGPQLWRSLKRVPAPLRPAVGAVARGVHRSGLGAGILPLLGLPASMTHKLGRLGQVAGKAGDFAGLYAGLTQSFDDPLTYLAPQLRRSLTAQDDMAPNMAFKGIGPQFSGLTGAQWMMAMDSVTYLPGDILVKVDRASMSTSLETRAPLLDGRVVKDAWALPEDLLIHNRQGKQALRLILDSYVPRDLIERPKQGFAIPIDRWLRGGLRSWAQDLLQPDRLAAEGLLDPVAVQDLWQKHLSGAANFGPQIWTLMALSAWAPSTKATV